MVRVLRLRLESAKGPGNQSGSRCKEPNAASERKQRQGRDEMVMGLGRGREGREEEQGYRVQGYAWVEERG